MRYIYQTRSCLSRGDIHNLTCELTPCSNPRSVEHQNPRHNGQQRANPAKQAARRTIPKLIIHLGRDEWEYAT